MKLAVDPPPGGAHTIGVRSRVMGVEIFHEEAGRGSSLPLLLLHGVTDSHHSWRGVLPGLSRSRRVLVPDLPGCGLSGRPDASYSLDWQATVIHAWLDQLGVGALDVVGHSYGGGVAQHMLLLRVARIRRLALVAAGGMGREVSLALRLASLPNVMERFGQRAMAPIAVRALRAAGGRIDADEEAWLRYVNGRPGTARAFARTVRDVIDWRGQKRHFLDRASELREFPPIALFWGSADPVIPHKQVVETLRVLRGAESTTFAGVGHFPHRERPAQFVSALEAFFGSKTVRPVRCVPPGVPTQASWQTRWTQWTSQAGQLRLDQS